MIDRMAVGCGAVCLLLALAVADPPAALYAQEGPEGRAHHQLVHHPLEGVVYLIGGSTPRGDSYYYFDDVWTWNGMLWSRAPRLPSPRSSHRVVYHSGRESLMLFGGGFSQVLVAEGVLWERKDGDWRSVAEDDRAGRSEPGMCYDRLRDRIVLFGGWNRDSEYTGTTWEWDGAQLLRVAATGPSPRSGHALFYDPSRRRCLLFGGRDASGYRADTWEWDGERWNDLQVEGPSPRWFFGSATDVPNSRIVIFGGAGPEGDLGDTWAWNGVRWTLLTDGGPPPRSMAKLAYDGYGILLFGGRQRVGDRFQDLADTWRFIGALWTPMDRR